MTFTIQGITVIDRDVSRGQKIRFSKCSRKSMDLITRYATNASIKDEFLGAVMDMLNKSFAIDHLAPKVQAMLAEQKTDDRTGVALVKIQE